MQVHISVGRAALTCFALTLASQVMAQSGVVELITPEEMAAEKSAFRTVPKAPPTLATATPGAPRIEIQLPVDLKSVTSPFPIKVAFRPADQAEISVESFKILYGMLKLDITDRVLKKTSVSKDGLEVKEAAIPAGSHTLVMRVKDSLGREGELRLGLLVN